MTREELEHIIRASGDITDQYEFVIVGSQSMLGPVPNPEAEFTMSMEADIYPLMAPELADRIDGAIGEGSQFHQNYGYYAQGVGPDTAMLPQDWMQRVHRVQNGNTNDRVGYCLDVIDLFLAKAVAGRDKDREFCMALFEHGYVTPAQVLELVPLMPVDDKEQRTLRATIRRWAKAVRDAGHDVSEG
ncbi:hypothetical protein PTW32_00775 [Dechloromonas agitata]|uniref:DUF6036 family nucleotidyltransferase n=1 Tax=Dechloromonas agitata TaxID=73030 RepID=UPI00237E48FB|nr:DUF6036 family nucleotidyltransferase [Dechloromonas agitata]MDD3443641.1 hypothetical protein [Sulfurimonas denitrificans]MDE1543933.1 hypothetical protein [Dechloromonas agitata]